MTSEIATAVPGSEEQKGSLLGRLLDVLEDHFSLLSLEAGYEAIAGRKRFIRLLAVGVCFAIAIPCMQVAVIAALLRSGAPLDAVCGGFAVFWGVFGFWVHRHGQERDPRLGEPFEGSRRELQRSLEWIRKHFS